MEVSRVPQPRALEALAINPRPHRSPNRRSFRGESGPLRTTEIFHRKIRRTEGERWGVRASAGGLVLPCAPNGGASNQTF
jgi:hypothetical protein